YYAATCLHPYYKYYCENSWVDKPEWLTSANAGFLQLWQSYKPQPSSCDCERLFSELGDLLEPRRRALGSELLAALQLVRSWRRAGFDGLYNNGDDEDKWSDVKDEEIVQQYDIEG
ncbi:hypothetical protein PtrCC142_011775, partial [Pyrenophora tritici-repentis]